MSNSPNHFAFISYRRDDSQAVAQGLYDQLRNRFGAGRFFMDVNTIQPGNQWPDRIKSALDKATVMIVIVGQKWLTAADKYGRRRLDLKDDWVRKEIAYALKRNIPLIPVLVSGASIPEDEALPPALKKLTAYQGVKLRNDSWDADLNNLAQRMIDYGFVENERRVILPNPQVTILPLSEDDLGNELSTLDGWEPVESLIPGEYPNTRQEIRKIYRFSSFRKAIQFMSDSIDSINETQHHPRWQNQWRTVTVWLTTWDIGNKISILDIQMARKLDEVYENLNKSG